jgi:DNA-binding response OmpR family regulator
MNRHPPQEEVMRTQPKPKTERRVVALVEDDAEFRNIVSRWLQPEYDTVGFADGEPLLSSDRELVPDLIVMDVKLRGLNGYSLCKKIHEQPRFAGVPVLFLTGVDSDEGFLNGIEAGAASYMAKPVERNDLLARVRELVDYQLNTTRIEGASP